MMAHDIIVIGVSAGGVLALQTLIAHIRVLHGFSFHLRKEAHYPRMWETS